MNTERSLTLDSGDSPLTEKIRRRRPDRPDYQNKWKKHKNSANYKGGAERKRRKRGF